MKFTSYVLRESIRGWLLGGDEADNHKFIIPPLEEELKAAIKKQDKFDRLEEILKKHGYKIKEIRFILDQGKK